MNKFKYMKDGVFERWLDHIDQQVQTELQSPHYDDLKKIKVAEINLFLNFIYLPL